MKFCLIYVFSCYDSFLVATFFNKEAYQKTQNRNELMKKYDRRTVIGLTSHEMKYEKLSPKCQINVKYFCRIMTIAYTDGRVLEPVIFRTS